MNLTELQYIWLKNKNRKSCIIVGERNVYNMSEFRFLVNHVPYLINPQVRPVDLHDFNCIQAVKTELG